MLQVRPLALAAALFASAAMPAFAGPLADAGAKADALVAEGKPVEALATIEAAFNTVWDLAPLGFSEALFVAAKPAGFGIYDARANAVFSPGEEMMVYAEPFGYGFGRRGDLFDIGFAADFELRNATGQILTRQTGFADLAMTSRRRNKEFQVFITYRFEGLKPGDYVLVTRLTDKHSQKAGSFELPFTVAGN